MKIVELSQGSPSWLSWRLNRITATDCSSIIGINPFKSIIDLYEEKTGIRQPQELNDAMRRGQELEPIARQLFINETGIEIEPIVCEHDEHYWHGSSLDGYCAANHIIAEIKCPNADAHQLAIQGAIKPYYYSQIQHQLFTTGAKLCYYISYNPNMGQKLCYFEVLPNEKYMENMFKMEKIFYEEHLCNFTPPSGDWTFKEK